MQTYRIRYLGPANRRPAIHLVREIVGVGLRAARELIETRAVLLDNVSDAEARYVVQRFAEVGAVVEIESTDREPSDREIARLEAASVRDRTLEAQLRERPDDVAAHLVYGDWLQARGDPRGQLVMLQHACEQATDPTALAGLQAREREFRNAHLDHLFGPLRELADTLVVRWSLGFIDAAFVGAGIGLRPDYGPMQVLRDLLRLPIATRMTSLGVTTSLLHHGELEAVLCESEVVGWLRELELGDHPSRHFNAELPRFARLWPHLHELRKLTIHADHPPLRTLRSDTLEHLELHVLQRCMEFPNDPLPRLRTLTLEFPDTEQLELVAFAELFALTSLYELREVIVRLPNNPLTADMADDLAHHHGGFAGLDVLDLSRCVADEDAMAVLVDARDRGRLPDGLRLPILTR